MCGRARCTLAPGEVVQHAGVQADNWKERDKYQACENVCPGRSTPVVYTDRHNRRAVRTMKWGLIPSYTKPNEKLDFFRMFNARIETVAEKPVFRRLVSSKRCVVLLDGFYEWNTDASKQKQPFYIHHSGRPMKMAGLYDVWKVPPSSSSLSSQQQPSRGDSEQHVKSELEHEEKQPEAEENANVDDEEGSSSQQDEFMFSYTILTTDASSRFSSVHSRMPVLLNDEQAEAWLSDSADANKLLVQFGPYNNEDLVWHPVTKKVNNLSYLDSDCAAPIKLVQPRSIASFWGAKKSNSEQAESKVEVEGKQKDSSHTAAAAAEAEQETERPEEHLSVPTVVDESSPDPDAEVQAPSSPIHTEGSTRLRSPLQSPLRTNKRPTKGSPSPKRQKTIASFFDK